MACHQKHKKKKTNLHNVKKNTFSKTAVSFCKILFKTCKKQVHKGYPLAGPCICNYKLELACAIRNNLSGSPVFFSPFFLFSCGWMVLNCDWMLFKSINKANLYTLKKQCLLQNSCFQSESNGDPIRAYQKREDLSEPELYQKPWGRVQISSLLLPPPTQKKEMGGGGFTIVDATWSRKLIVDLDQNHDCPLLPVKRKPMLVFQVSFPKLAGIHKLSLLQRWPTSPYKKNMFKFLAEGMKQSNLIIYISLSLCIHER